MLAWFSKLRARHLLGIAVLALSAGCDAPPPEEVNDFTSFDPTFAPLAGNLSVATVGASTGVGGSDLGTPPDDPAREIAEADVVQVDGDRLYAVSSFSGLTVIDVTDPDHMVVLGRKRLTGEARDMHILGTTVYVTFRDAPPYVAPVDPSPGPPASHVEALDTSDPSAIESLGAGTIPGWLLETRRVGDVLYAVAFEPGGCNGCELSPSTTVTSFDVSSPMSFAELDHVRLDEVGYSVWASSVVATTDRLYIGGVDDVDAGTSSIQLVDISDPSGALVLGATVPIDGRISSRWQMDEHQGVLRVVSQRSAADSNPWIETFTISSSDVVTPLAKTEIVLPVSEELRTVRFDGDRAFAVTVEQLDPLFTIDLSDPAAPTVRGELSMPGWIHHVEPRGDELVALGFDPTDPEGALNVSLLDVANLDAPALVDRVAFGPGGASFGGNPNEIDDAFEFLPDLDLLVVPFHAETADTLGCPVHESGVQLVDWMPGSLVKRGVAPVRGFARRAFTHRGRLFGMSDEQVRAFDVSDRDLPVRTSDVQLSTSVARSRFADATGVRLAADWWTSVPRIETVPAEDPGRDQPLGSVDLGDVLADVGGGSTCFSGFEAAQHRLFTHGSTVYVVWPSVDRQVARVVTVDVTDPSNPVVLGKIDVPTNRAGYGEMLVASGDSVVQVGTRLAFQFIEGGPNFDAYYHNVGVPIHGGSLTVVELADPTTPEIVRVVPLPQGLGHTGLLVTGGQVAFSHWEPAGAAPEVRFFLDRLDVEGASPALAPPINVPGSLVAYDSATRHLLSVDYQQVTALAADPKECRAKLGEYANFHPGPAGGGSESGGRCDVIDRSFKVSAVDEVGAEASLLDVVALSIDEALSTPLVGDDRAFFSTFDRGEKSTRLGSIGGIRAGKLVLQEPDETVAPGASAHAVDGQTLIAASGTALFALDATDPSAPQATKLADLPFWAQEVTVIDGRALVSLGPYGVMDVELP